MVRTQESFWAREVCWKRGTFDKCFMYDVQKNHAGKHSGGFSPKYSNNCILNENVTHRCTQTGYFFPI